MAYYITGDCHAHFEKLIWLARFNKELGKEDVIILRCILPMEKRTQGKATELLNGLMIMEHWDKRKKFLMILWEFHVNYRERKRCLSI